MILDKSIMSYKSIQTIICLSICFLIFSCQNKPISKLDFSDGSYEGEINRDGQKHGSGIYRWLDGSTYVGEYAEDLRHGTGRFLWVNGESYKGDYLKDERTGKGIYDWPDGSQYEGDFLAGKRHGMGRFISSQNVIYEGEWFDDLQHGMGTLTYLDGRTLNGVWRQGELVSKPAKLPPASSKPKLSKPPLEGNLNYQVQTAPSSEPVLGDADIPTPKAEKIVLSNQSSETDVALPKDIIIVQPHTNTSTPPITDDASDSQETEQTEALEQKDLISEQINSSKQTVESTGVVDWEGTVSEAEAVFITELIDGIDTIRIRQGGAPFTGSMRILNAQGLAQGEVNLLNGRLHGEEIFFDRTGEITERNFWDNGRPIGR